MNNNSKALITSVSNKFFPSLLNLIGSIKQNYPNHPHIFIYDLGLNFLFKKQIKKIKNVSIIEIPHFVSFWRSCYTCKTYIINTPLADLNFYLDAGCQILKPLDEVFEKIEKNDYLLVSQGSVVTIQNITPKDYLKLFDIKKEKETNEIIAAGIFGFKKDSQQIKTVTEKLYQAGLNGLCLGFSPTEQWKNKGVNKNDFIRDCKMFRHDTTLLTLLIIKYLENPIIENIEKYSGEKTGNSNQILWNLRMNYKKLEYANFLKLTLLVKIFLFLFLKAKTINRLIKFRKI